jgi:hypothetical protein
MLFTDCNNDGIRLSGSEKCHIQLAMGEKQVKIDIFQYV